MCEQLSVAERTYVGLAPALVFYKFSVWLCEEKLPLSQREVSWRECVHDSITTDTGELITLFFAIVSQTYLACR
jgi:hypothetical protein